MTNHRKFSRRALVLGAGAVTAAGAFGTRPIRAQTPSKVTLGTNWRAQAEHGGFYQALATGLYAKAGLDVTIRMGGPQVNHVQLLAAGAIDFNMGADTFSALNYVKNNVPMVCVASIFQKDPRVLLAHPGQGNDTLAALKGKPILIGGGSRATYWQYLKAVYGYTEEQVRPYTFSVAPFLADKSMVQQGFLTSEPLQMEKAGIKPVIHLLADSGYSSYANTIETSWKLVQESPDVVQRFVDASIEGWYSYLYKDPSPANALIKKDNPDMPDDQIAYSIGKLKEYGIIDSGDALKLGIGAMNEARYKDFHAVMAKTGMYAADLDLSKAYTLQFVNKGHGMSIKS